MEIGKRKQEPTVQVAVPVSKLSPAVRRAFGLKNVRPFGRPAPSPPKPYSSKIVMDPSRIMSKAAQRAEINAMLPSSKYIIPKYGYKPQIHKDRFRSTARRHPSARGARRIKYSDLLR